MRFLKSSCCSVLLLLCIYSRLCDSQYFAINLDGSINEWPASMYHTQGGYWGVAMKSAVSNSFFVAAQYASTNSSTDAFAIALDFNAIPSGLGSDTILCRGEIQVISFKASTYLCWNGTAMEIYVTNGVTWSVNGTLTSFVRNPNSTTVTWELEIPYAITQDNITYNSTIGNTVLFAGFAKGSGIPTTSLSSDKYHGFFLNTGAGSQGISCQYPQYYATYPYVFDGSGVWGDSSNWLNNYVAGTAGSLPANAMVAGNLTIATVDQTVAYFALLSGTLSIADSRYLNVEGITSVKSSSVFISNTAKVTGNGFISMSAPGILFSENNSSVSIPNLKFSSSGVVDNTLINISITNQLYLESAPITFLRRVQYSPNSTLVYKAVNGSGNEWPATTTESQTADVPYIPYDVKFTSCLAPCLVQIPNNTYLLVKHDVLVTQSTLTVQEISDSSNLVVLKNFNVTNLSVVTMKTDLQVGGRISVDQTSSLNCDSSSGGKYLIADSEGSYYRITPGLSVCANGLGCKNATDNELVLFQNGSVTVTLINATSLSDFMWRLTTGNTTVPVMGCQGSINCTFNGTTANQTIRFIAKEQNSKCYSYISVVLRATQTSVTSSPSASPLAPSASPSPTVASSSSPSASSSPSSDPEPSTSPESVNPDSTKSKGGNSVALIAGVVVGGVVVVAAVLVAALFLKRRNKKQDSTIKSEDLELSNGSNGHSAAVVTPPEPAKRQSKTDRDWEIPFTELELGKELGRGAFGVVFKCRWRNTDCVAKQLDINRSDEHSIKQFLKEADNVKGLRPHTNVCNVFGICTDPAFPICIIMEYLPDGSLDQLVYKNKIGLDDKMILDFAKDIASGMSHIHHENVLHCDLACRNLLLTARGVNKYTVKIADFGLSRVTETDTYNASTTTSFPVRWTAPETLQSGKITRASDVWSFGVVLWEIAEGKRPYPDLSNSDVIKAVCDKGVRLPRPERVQILDELWDLMNRCWDSEPENRPSFNEIYSELRKIDDKYFGEDDQPSKENKNMDHQDNYNIHQQKDYYNTQQKDYYNNNAAKNDNYN